MIIHYTQKKKEMELEERLQRIEKTVHELIEENKTLKTELENVTLQLQYDKEDIEVYRIGFLFNYNFCNNVLLNLSDELLYQFNKKYGLNFLNLKEETVSNLEFSDNSVDNKKRYKRMCGCISYLKSIVNPDQGIIRLPVENPITRTIINNFDHNNCENWTDIYNYTLYLKQQQPT
jgi:hypothetical protein